MSDRTEQACAHWAPDLMGKANVVGVAGGDTEVLVFVTRKRPLAQLASRDVVPDEVDGVHTDVIEVGELTAMLGPGDSIGVDGLTGTAGGIVTDEHGNLFILTNNHVAANSNRVLSGTPIVHPGPADGAGSQIGRLGRHEPLTFHQDNYLDAALVALDPGIVVAEDRLPRPTSTTARVGWAVHKHGRTSGLTHGKVLARNGTFDVDFGSLGLVRFAGQIVTDKMLDPGDSGSVILSRNRYPVALGFAGSDTISLHNPIALVLRTLAVRFI